MSDETEQAYVFEAPNTPHQISFIVKGKAELTIWVTDEMAAVFMSNPEIVYSTGVHVVTSQTEYDSATKTFTHPGGEKEQAKEYNPGS